MNIKRLLATAAMTTGFAIGTRRVANAEPIGEIGDKAGFDECVNRTPRRQRIRRLLRLLRRIPRRGPEPPGVCYRTRHHSRRRRRSLRPENSPEKACAVAPAQPPGSLPRVARPLAAECGLNCTVTSAHLACIKPTLGPRDASEEDTTVSANEHLRACRLTTCRRRSPRLRFPRAPSGEAGCSTAS